MVITITEALNFKDAVFIDTRTPKEYEEDHLPGAINLPILSNEERAIVGTLFKQVSKEKAIKQGMQFFSPKLPHFLEEITKYKDKRIIIYCWRGGMRSKTVVSLFSALGYDVEQLQGGYKSYRLHVRERLSRYVLKPKIIVLWGLTCTGKTELLSKFSDFLDLEGLAQHRSSLYGSIGLTPRSQKSFENLLLQSLDQLNDKKQILIEGESRKIGDVEMPPFLWKAMNNGLAIQVTRSLEKRAQACVKEYFSSSDHVQKIRETTVGLWKVISKKRKQEVLDLIDNKQYKEAAAILLSEYYDPLYGHTLKKKDFAFTLDNDDVDRAEEILTRKLSL
ncbi:tRNA 2-selenouridine(34) synthase MnmH [Candidatus Woesearchaeota archaeon CG10_big_fil_rev_8_21_14_0_10_45_16]|nr:MAG: tRNA 2-selenouridine(34) synthase MnmH [Candidatus Woesearchaeota archaeon CG10_big_fil_rev_8_21_14_0_10_45_16]